jgi:glucose/arabinose dehydrogenase
MSPGNPVHHNLLTLVVLLFVALTPAGGNAAGTGPIYLPLVGNGAPMPSQVHLTPVATGLSAITDLTHAGDGRLFIAEQGGRVRILKEGVLLANPFLDLSGRIACCGERGLLGLAFHPSYATRGHFFVNYTYLAAGSELRSRVSRFSVSAASADVADPASEVILLEYEQPYTNHNGGALHFGAGGYLYIATGDGGGSYDPQGNAQNTGNLLGKILRVDVDTTTGAAPDCGLAAGGNYRIPEGNPLADGSKGACDEIWAYGLRNPWRFSFDPQSGDLWIADVGQGAREEINVQTAASAGGENYGWDCWEGTVRNTANDPSPICASNPPVQAPLYEYDHSGGKCSITGGDVYRGAAYPQLQGLYFFADFCSGELWALRRTTLRPAVTELATTGATLINPRTFGQDSAGELYVASPSTVYRISHPAAVAPPAD